METFVGGKKKECFCWKGWWNLRVGRKKGNQSELKKNEGKKSPAQCMIDNKKRLVDMICYPSTSTFVHNHTPKIQQPTQLLSYFFHEHHSKPNCTKAMPSPG